MKNGSFSNCCAKWEFWGNSGSHKIRREKEEGEEGPFQFMQILSISLELHKTEVEVKVGAAGREVPVNGHCLWFSSGVFLCRSSQSLVSRWFSPGIP